MDARTSKCNVLVIGGGPAGTLVATSLTKAGKDVIQLVKTPENRGRPFEVLSPSTRRLLVQNGLKEPVHNASACRGVLSCWEAPPPSFYDYVFNTSIAGLAIDRTAFHQSLIADAINAGVHVIQGQVLQQIKTQDHERCNFRFQVNGQLIAIMPEQIVDARGRQAGMLFSGNIKREYCSQLVALSTSFSVKQWRDCLLLEATEDGWWYVPPAINDLSQLVFLTDMDLLPAHGNRRGDWLKSCYLKSRLLQDLANNTPTFHNLKGTDARFSRLERPFYNNYLTAGDTAIALDPLSGTGTRTALEGAAEIAALILRKQNIEKHYYNWCCKIFDQEQQRYRQTYSAAASRFTNAPFWKRRSFK